MRVLFIVRLALMKTIVLHRLKFFRVTIISVMLVFALQSEAFATYIVAITGDDFVVIGGESRVVYSNGTYSDTACKIIPLGNHSAFSLVGSEAYVLANGSDEVHISDLAEIILPAKP